MKIAHLLLCSTAILSMVACKKSPNTAAQSRTQVTDTPNVATIIDTTTAWGLSTKTYKGNYTERTDDGVVTYPTAFHIRYIKPGMAIVFADNDFQVADYDMHYNEIYHFHDTINYNGPGEYWSGRVKLNITTAALTVTWEYYYWRCNGGDPIEYEHECNFYGGKQ